MENLLIAVLAGLAACAVFVLAKRKQPTPARSRKPLTNKDLDSALAALEGYMKQGEQSTGSVPSHVLVEGTHLNDANTIIRKAQARPQLYKSVESPDGVALTNYRDVASLVTGALARYGSFFEVSIEPSSMGGRSQASYARNVLALTPAKNVLLKDAFYVEVIFVENTREEILSLSFKDGSGLAIINAFKAKSTFSVYEPTES